MSLETPEKRNRPPISTRKVHTKIVKPLPDDAETALKFSPETFPAGQLVCCIMAVCEDATSTFVP